MAVGTCPICNFAYANIADMLVENKEAMELNFMAEERREERTKGKQTSGEMTVSEAGRMGGERVRELIEEGKESEREQGKRSSKVQSSKSS
jgi:hypothetical protein